MGSVTWGANTVHTIGSPASAAPAPSTGFSFGSPGPAPSGGGLFGSSPAPSGGMFGNPAPAPGGGLFGSAPGSGGGLFGSAPAPGGGLFGSAPSSGGIFGSAPAPGGLFGSAPAPGGGIFGSTQSLFGQPQYPQQPQVPQIPAQAALQAHLDAEARQEEARVKHALETLHQTYTGTAVAQESTIGIQKQQRSAPFTCILYNPVTQQQRQQQWLQCSLPYAQAGDQMHHQQMKPVVPQRPLQISESDWNQAVVQNEDLNYMPSAMIGASALQARLTHQQEVANNFMTQLKHIKEAKEIVQERSRNSQQQLDIMIHSKHEQQRKRLLEVMKKIEILRCFNQPLQRDEMLAMQKLKEIYQYSDQLRSRALQLSEAAESASNNSRTLKPQPATSMAKASAVPSKQLLPILTEHREQLTKLTETIKKDMRDLDLIQERVLTGLSISNDNLPPPPRG